MGLSWWLGIGAGLAVICLHALLRVLTHRFALRASSRRSFLFMELGGLGVRMTAVFGGVGLVCLFVPVHLGTFVATVIALLILTMIYEVRLVIRQMDHGTLSS